MSLLGDEWFDQVVHVEMQVALLFTPACKKTSKKGPFRPACRQGAHSLQFFPLVGFTGYCATARGRSSGGFSSGCLYRVLGLRSVAGDVLK